MDIIRKIIREQIEILFKEEYDASSNTLYGYHVTSASNIESIKNNGFKVGDGKMQGKGFYAFYDYDHAVRYLMKSHNDLVLIKFEISLPERLLYLNMNIAKEVLGSNYHLKQQLEKYYKYHGGIDYVFELAKNFKKDLDMEGFLDILNKIETDNSEQNQRILPLNMMPSSESDKLNICWNGNYGLEYRINNLNLIKPLGYITFDQHDGKESYFRFSDLEKIPDTEEFNELKKLASNFSGTLSQLRREIDKKHSLVRNNREYDYYTDLLEKLRKIGY